MGFKKGRKVHREENEDGDANPPYDPSGDIPPEFVQALAECETLAGGAIGLMPEEGEFRWPSDFDEAALATKLGMERPYLFCDVECRLRDQGCTLRDKLHDACQGVWLRETTGGDEVLKIPVPPGVPDEQIILPPPLNGDHYTSEDMRAALKKAQLDNQNCRIMIDVLRDKLGSRPNAPQERDTKRVPPSDVSRFRLNPFDSVLEAKVIVAAAVCGYPLSQMSLCNCWVTK